MSVEELRPRDLGEGASRAAPTAPHATDPEARAGRAQSGPERFWARTPVRIALAVALVVSALAHAPMLPLRPPSSFEMREVEGEAAIPIDVLSPDGPAPPPPAPEPAPPDPEENNAPLPAATRHRDAGTPLPNDAGPRDGALDAPADAVAAADAGDAEGPALSLLEDAGPKDPHAFSGATAAVQPKVVNVVLVISSEVIRKNPIGATLGYLLRGIPQWGDFMLGTSIDPVRDTDWFMVSGASLVNTERDVVLVRYAAPDALIDRAIAYMGRRYARGGPMDLGVPGVRGVLTHADRADRAILRPGPHLIAIVPPADAKAVARQLAGARVQPPIAPGEAVYLRFVHPQGPFPELPDSIRELRLRVVPRDDAGADVYIEGDTPDAASAVVAAQGVARVVRRHDDMLTSLVTHGLLDHVDVRADGTLVKAHLLATRDQIEAVVGIVGAVLGVSPPVPGAGSSGSPGGSAIPPSSGPPARRGTASPSALPSVGGPPKLR